MIGWRHFGFEFVLLVVICVGALFLFPIAHGSYSAVHGPVTALRSIKNRFHISLISVLAAFSPVPKCLLVGNSRLFFQAYTDVEFFFSDPDQMVLRR